MARKQTSRTKSQQRRKQITSRERQRRRRQAVATRDTSRDDYTIQEWCAKRRVSRGLFYKMLADGTAPATIKCRKRAHHTQGSRRSLGARASDRAALNI